MTKLGSEDLPLRVAIIGAGPSGFYAADSLYKSDINVTIDAFDKLPTPYGLLRGGVAPDHQRMKSVGNYYERIALKNPTFSFWGNVTIGKDISINELKEYYDAIIISSGAETDKKLGIKGEDLNGSYTATEFVAWYNGHPDYQENKFNLNKEKVAIIGQGNVAIDVTRILAKTEQELSTSDITENALSQLKNSSIKEIHLIGRRGPAQAAFTELEIKELGELEDCDIVINTKDLELGEACKKEAEESNKSKKNIAILNNLCEKENSNKSKKIILHFLKSPLEITGESNVTGLTLEKNQLSGEAGSQKARGTGETEELACDLVFRSIGYKGVPISQVPFDEQKGIIPNEKGRVQNGSSELTRLYVSGWIKRGATGVLGTNKPDSKETIETLIEDLPQLNQSKHRSSDDLKALLNNRNVRIISFEDWKKIDDEETKRGQEKNKPREKFTSTESILKFLDK